MFTQQTNPKENKKEVAANVVTQKMSTGKKSIELEDNRLQAVAQRQLQTLISGSPVLQRIVRPDRGNPGKFKSSLIRGEVFDTREDAQKAENEVKLQQSFREPPPYVKKKHKGEIPKFKNSFSKKIHEKKGPLGPLVTRGGHITPDQYNSVTGREPQKEDANTLFSGSNTYSGVFTNQNYLAEEYFSLVKRDTSIHNLDDLPEVLEKPKEFFEESFFMQGKNASEEDVHLPKEYKSPHSETKAGYSDAFKQATDKTMEDMQDMMEICDVFDENKQFEIDAEPDDRQIEQLCNYAAMPFQGGTILAINRASCKKNKDNKKGCTDEMGKVSVLYHQQMVDKLGQQAAYLSKQFDKNKFTVSVAGAYKEQGNPQDMTDMGIDLQVHNPINWKTGMHRDVEKNISKWYKEVLEKSKESKGLESGSYFKAPFKKDEN
ncbi:hypothetical protein ACQY1Q_11335 [Tenacibaculum sp. TC6]|uniref:hypothetical protein n=1 Tax=Tenacibaculum sp. TC6 TaxID=3423223 RepID=UPI003D36863F